MLSSIKNLFKCLCANNARHDSLSEEMVVLDYVKDYQSKYPASYLVSNQATNAIIKHLKGNDFTVLAKNSPHLKGFQWEIYIQLSLIRMIHIIEALKTLKVDFKHLKILDFGSYFGNFSLGFSLLNSTVHAIDSYKKYQDCFDSIVDEMKTNNIKIFDFEETGVQLDNLPKNSYDVVLCLGVIEHIPHTPRLMLSALDSIIKPGGYLVLDTPNLGYIYNRQKLMRGESIHPPIAAQYETKIPFEGHHREYTLDEVLWMISKMGYELAHQELFNYSTYCMSSLTGIHLDNYRAMEKDPSCREIILAIAKKPWLE